MKRILKTMLFIILLIAVFGVLLTVTLAKIYGFEGADEVTCPFEEEALIAHVRFYEQLSQIMGIPFPHRYRHL